MLTAGTASGLGAQVTILAVDGLAVIGTIGFFGPAAILLALVTGAVVRDRRLVAREHEGDGGEPRG